MTNDRLRAALQQAGVQPDELAEIVQVDVRTVRRWLAGTTPYARQRAKVARALDTTEHNVWPDAVAAAPATPAAAQPADRIATYSSLSALDAPDWKQMMRDAIEHIDLLGTTLKQPLAVSGLPGLLAAKAQNGCQVRVLVSDPGPHLTPYIEQQGIGIHVLDDAAAQTIYRFDSQLLLILHLGDQSESDRPFLHIRRTSDGGLFDRIAGHLQICWDDGSEPIDPKVDIYRDDLDGEEPEEQTKTDRMAGAEPPAATRTTASASPPRRWPGRPD
jgi:transcriptional regulator with XRE-family HTH domain